MEKEKGVVVVVCGVDGGGAERRLCVFSAFLIKCRVK